MGDSTDNFLPVDQLAVEDLATEAAKAWRNIRELTLAYREANDKFYPAKFEYNQALRDTSANGSARRFAAKNTLRDVVNSENSAYSALLAGKKRFNDIQQRRLEIAKSMAASGFHQQNIGGGDSGGGDGGGSVTGGAENAGRLIYSWLRRTTTGFFTSGKYVMTSMKKNLRGVDGRVLKAGANDFMSAAFGSRNAVWASKFFGRMSGLLSGSPMGMLGSAFGIVSDIVNNMSDKARSTASASFGRYQESIVTGLTQEQVKQIKDIGEKYGAKEGQGSAEFFGFVAGLQQELNRVSIEGGLPRGFEKAMMFLPKLGKNIGNLLNQDAYKNTEKILEAIMDSAQDELPHRVAAGFGEIGARGATAEILKRGKQMYETDKVDVALSEQRDLEKEHKEALRLGEETARTKRAKEADAARHIEGKTDVAVAQEKGKQLAAGVDALGFWQKAGILFGKMLSANSSGTSLTGIRQDVGGQPVSVVLPDTVPVEAETAAKAGGGNVDKSVTNEFSGDIYVQTTASSLDGVTEAAVAQGLANAYSNAKK